MPVPESKELAISANEESIATLRPHILAALDQFQFISDQPKPPGRAEAVRHSSSRSSIVEMLGLNGSTSEERIVAAIHLEYDRRWANHADELNRILHRRAAPTWIQLIFDECAVRNKLIDPQLVEIYSQIVAARGVDPCKKPDANAHHGLPPLSVLPFIDPHQRFDEIRRRLTEELPCRTILLWQHDPASLAAFGGEMDRVLQMPGWTNVWTKPIQNRVDMLATGVNAEVGVRVLGRTLDQIVQISDEIAAVLKEVPGAADVVADPIRGKGLIRIAPDAAKLSEAGVSPADLQATLEMALSGTVIGHLVDGRERKSIRIRLEQQSNDESDETLRRLPIPYRPVQIEYRNDQTDKALSNAMMRKQVFQTRRGRSKRFRFNRSLKSPRPKARRQSKVKMDGSGTMFV